MRRNLHFSTNIVNYAVYTLQWNGEQQHGHADQRRPPQILPHQVGAQRRLHGPDPEVMHEKWDDVQAVDVVGHEIRGLSGAGFAASPITQFQGL